VIQKNIALSSRPYLRQILTG